MTLNDFAKAIAASAGIALGTIAPAHAATLAGKGTFQTADDLTLIDVSGTVFEWLDLTVTDGTSPAGAIAALSGFGFSWATEAQIIDLLDAFNTTYVSSPGSVVDLGMATGDREGFVNHFGPTFSNASLGWYDTGGGNSYMCVSVSACGPASFTWVDRIDLSVPDANVGVFMVRPADTAPVPLPAALPFLLASLCGLAAVSRRRG